MSAWTLRGGTIVDGTGRPGFVGNVVLEDDRVAVVEGREERGTVLDADGLVVCPGFVDIHSHTNWIAPLAEGPELLAPNVLQGITTSVAGNCGISPAPLGEAFRHSVKGCSGRTSPRSSAGAFWGTVARFLGHFGRGLGLLPLEETAHRITELPARRVGLQDRGVLGEGAAADVVVFDPGTIGDRGTVLDPLPAGGIQHVFVNGQPVVSDGAYDPARTAARALRVRRRKQR